ncbi:hypothetical protein GIR22_16115 [Pseudomonas sp. CCM 7891]|uniref:Uncharacterized protein n=1 Tax=Pseudomonas karstica TaxID=1055468 RepID=A0A7X2UZ14_9PSED|nr:hypothetical protein [Pseudomonas karstica]MTD20654.1 hypothetical protein [Pseudomonas karstica]
MLSLIAKWVQASCPAGQNHPSHHRRAQHCISQAQENLRTEFATNPAGYTWEFSPLYCLDQETIYRQMMSLLDNSCEGKPAQMRPAVIQSKHR